MNLAELIYRYRLEARDRADPPLTSDKDVALWFNDAVRQAAIRRRLIVDDATTAVCQIPYVLGRATYPLHPSVYEIISLRVERAVAPDCPHPLTLRSREWMDRNHPGWRQEPWPSWRRWSGYAIQDDTSLKLTTDYEAGDIIRIEAYRTPLEPMCGNQDEPEIHPIHHEHLVDWVLHKVFGQVDADLFDPLKADQAEKRFTDYFGPMPDADLRRDTREDEVQHNYPIFL